MAENFTPGWVSCLDESMSGWENRWTCPGWIFVPRKPTPFGNEYHTICCAVSGILYAIELVEGKDRPRQAGAKEFDNLGPTVGLLLRLTKSLWHTGKVVILDSGFCVLSGIIELKKRGVFASALIKKRRYWPKYIRGDDINNHFQGKEVGCTEGWAEELQNESFHVFALKDVDYVMSLMSSYGTTERNALHPTERIVNGAKISFHYPEVHSNHFKFRHAVDDHNSKRHAPISLEETWATKYWPNRVFAFILGVTEVNALLGAIHYKIISDADKISQLQFRKELARQLIINPYHTTTPEGELRRSPRNSVEPSHSFETLPRAKKFKGALIVDAKSDYPQRGCHDCGTKVRTFCRCSPGVHRCVKCFAVHFGEIVGVSQSTD
jgi:hypothetical protein